MEVLLNSPLTKSGEGVEVPKAAGVARVIGVLMTLTDLLPPMEEERRKMDFPVKSISPKGHSSDVTEAFQQWARCITYYRDYYEDSYLMLLVVSSLMGDASDVFGSILSLNPGNTQDLTTLLQMLREHDCGSLTFREQRNTIENLHQRP